MIVIPAIDLRDGRCAQVIEGTPVAADLALDRPVDLALAWERLGFRRLHVMDLDATAGLEPSAVNEDALRDLLGDLSIPAQVGGGVRQSADIDRLLHFGASYVLLGPRALEDPDWLTRTAHAFPSQLLVAARVNDLTVAGPDRQNPRRVLDLLEELNDLPLAGVLLAPDFPNDQLGARDVFLVEDAAETSAHPLLIAGGVRTLLDLRALAERGVAGAIVAQALYSGALDPRAVAEEFRD